jgi:hypothetical protein
LERGTIFDADETLTTFFEQLFETVLLLQLLQSDKTLPLVIASSVRSCDASLELPKLASLTIFQLGLHNDDFAADAATASSAALAAFASALDSICKTFFDKMANFSTSPWIVQSVKETLRRRRAMSMPCTRGILW